MGRVLHQDLERLAPGMRWGGMGLLPGRWLDRWPQGLQGLEVNRQDGPRKRKAMGEAATAAASMGATSSAAYHMQAWRA